MYPGRSMGSSLCSQVIALRPRSQRLLRLIDGVEEFPVRLDEGNGTLKTSRSTLSGISSFVCTGDDS